MVTVKLYSWDDGVNFWGRFTSVEAAVLDAIVEDELSVGDIVTVGELLPANKRDLVEGVLRSDDILDRLSEHASDVTGAPAAEDWPQMSSEYERRMQEAMVEAVMPFIDEPDFGPIGETQEVEVTDELYLRAHKGSSPAEDA